MDIARADADDGTRDAFVGDVDFSSIGPALRDEVLIRDVMRFGRIENEFAHAAMCDHRTVEDAQKRPFP